jgi:hypothetical protein
MRLNMPQQFVPNAKTSFAANLQHSVTSENSTVEIFKEYLNKSSIVCLHAIKRVGLLRCCTKKFTHSKTITTQGSTCAKNETSLGTHVLREHNRHAEAQARRTQHENVTTIRKRVLVSRLRNERKKTALSWQSAQSCCLFRPDATNAS